MSIEFKIIVFKVSSFILFAFSYIWASVISWNNWLFLSLKVAVWWWGSERPVSVIVYFASIFGQTDFFSCRITIVPVACASFPLSIPEWIISRLRQHFDSLDLHQNEIVELFLYRLNIYWFDVHFPGKAAFNCHRTTWFETILGRHESCITFAILLLFWASFSGNECFQVTLSRVTSFCSYSVSSPLFHSFLTRITEQDRNSARLWRFLDVISKFVESRNEPSWRTTITHPLREDFLN